MEAEEQFREKVQKYCTSIAKNRLLVQAAGGNVSWKSGDTLWIKASGTWLADAERKEIFVPVDRRPIEAALAIGDFSISSQAVEGYTLRPSIETLLHALMPQKFVVHLHPVDVVAHLVRPDCVPDLKAAIGDSLEWVVVDYNKPGPELAQAVYFKLCGRSNVQVVLLKNHGVIVAAETIDKVDQQLQTLCQRLRIPSRPIIGCVSKLTQANSALDGTSYKICADEALQCLATDPELYNRLENSWAICPDHVVFLGAHPIRVDELSPLPDAVMALDPAPPFVFVKGKGVLENQTATEAQKAQLSFYLDVMVRQPVGLPLEGLGHDEVASLIQWDAEKYRLTLNQ
jgi:rhamnose utilization protein RhaD (predicted bifunctional aldolase and dehydrogenase)